MAIGSNARGIRAQMGIAFDIPVPAGRAPNYQGGRKYARDDADGLFHLVPKAVGNRRDDEGGDENPGRDVPEGHPAIMARSIVNFKVPHVH